MPGERRLWMLVLQMAAQRTERHSLMSMRLTYRLLSGLKKGGV